MPNVIAVAVAALLAFAAGWMAQGWRADARIQDIRATAAAEAIAAAQDAGKREQALRSAIAEADAAGTAQIRKLEDENSSLRRAVDSGRQRLLVRARCPSPAGVPAGPAGAGMDPGTGTELDPDARPDYFALRSGLERLETKLSACQGALRGYAGGGSAQP